jgi:hypothetical protein
MLEKIHESPNTALVQAIFIVRFHCASLHGTGTIGIDHNVVVAKSLSDVIILDFHNLVASIAAHIKNQTIAMQSTEVINLQNPAVKPHTFSFINHHKISCCTGATD